LNPSDVIGKVTEADVFDEAESINVRLLKNAHGKHHAVTVASINWQAIEIFEGREVAGKISKFRSAPNAESWPCEGVATVKLPREAI
jgi:hypothetical protein